MTLLIVLLMAGSGVAALIVPGFESWSWILSVVGVFTAMWLRARRMQAHETDADLRAIELCGDPGRADPRAHSHLRDQSHPATMVLGDRGARDTPEPGTAYPNDPRSHRRRLMRAPEPIERLVVAVA